MHYEDQSRVAALLYIGMLTLPALQRKVLQGLYGEEPRTITDLSREFKISAAQVKEERNKALQNMRRYFCENPLPARPAL